MTLAKSILRVVLATVLVLLILFTANLLLPGMTWKLDDFITAGILLLGSGLVLAVISRVGDSTTYRLAVGVAVMAGLLLVWGNLAVGFIGNEDNPANLLYGGVLAVAFIGALAARLRPRGMAHAMFAAALVQFLVPLVAAAIWRPEVNIGMMQVLALNTVFAMLWVGSGLLFRRASATGAKASHQLA